MRAHILITAVLGRMSSASDQAADAVSGIVWVFVAVAVIAAVAALGGLLVLVRRGNRRD